MTSYAVVGTITCLAVFGAFLAMKNYVGGDSGELNGSDKKKKKKDQKFPNFTKKPSSSSSSATIESSSEGGEGESMKGYKTTADGRKTSYFTRDISEEDKRILAQTNTGPVRLSGPGDSTQNLDFTPAKIENSGSSVKSDSVNSVSSVQGTTTATGGPSSPNRVSGGSQWNSAGTFEEKDVSEWAKSHLTKKLMDLKVINKDMNVFIEKVRSVEGDASVIFTRGKFKFVYDLTIELDFHMTEKDHISTALLSAASDTKGKVRISDITAECEYEFHGYEVMGRDKSRKVGGHYHKYIQNLNNTSVWGDEGGSLFGRVRKTLDDFLGEMQEKYKK